MATRIVLGAYPFAGSARFRRPCREGGWASKRQIGSGHDFGVRVAGVERWVLEIV